LLGNYAAGLIYLFVRAGQQVALLPAFLFAWGPGLYGQWILLSSAAAFIGLIDLGTRPYLHNRLLLLREAGDLAGYHRTFQVSLAVLLISAAAGLTALAVGVLSAAEARLLGNEFIAANDAAFLLGALGVRALLDIPLDLLSNPQWARREVTRNIVLNTVWLALEMGAMVAGLLLHLPPAAIAVISVAVRGGFLLYLAVEIPWRYAELRLAPALPDAREPPPCCAWACPISACRSRSSRVSRGWYWCSARLPRARSRSSRSRRSACSSASCGRSSSASAA
jgi:hypothetical protein